jgi:Domain of unknown function DUF29
MMGAAGFSFKLSDVIFARRISGAPPAMSEVKTLYDEDFVQWSKQQAEALRAAGGGATNQPIDWENVAEEIDSLARSENRELGSQIKRILHHLLKLQHSAARNPRRGWENSVIDARDEIEDLLDRSPSLKREISTEIARQAPRAARLAIRDLGKRAEADPAIVAKIRTIAYTEDQILGDWFPPEPGEPVRSAE